MNSFPKFNTVVETRFGKMEESVLRGGEKTIRKHRPVLQTSCLWASCSLDRSSSRLAFFHFPFQGLLDARKNFGPIVCRGLAK